MEPTKEVRQYMGSLGKIGGKSKSKKKLRAIMKNLKIAHQVSKNKERKRK